MPTSNCPECSEEVYVDAECEQGDHVKCDECGSSLEVVGLDPLELDLMTDADDDHKSEGDDFDSYDYDDHHY
jgi:lysine biosynthesis protein LysW